MVSDLGLQWLDYGARWYDPSVGRFTGVDPLAEEYASISPNAFVANNPLIYIDPDGMQIIPTDDKSKSRPASVDKGLSKRSSSVIKVVYREKGKTVIEK